MATVGIQLDEWSGFTGLSIELREFGSGTVVNTGGDSLTEDGSTGYFTGTIAESLTGLHNVSIKRSGAVIWTGGLVNMSEASPVVGHPTQLDGLLTVGANVVQISGDSTAADNAEAFFDGTGYAGTGNTIPTVTTVTNAVTLPSIPNNWITSAGITDGAFTAAKFASGAFDAVWSVTSRTLSAATNISSAIAAAVWEVATSGLSTAGTIGKLLVDNINATIGSRSSHSAADVWASGTRTLTAIDEDATTLDLDATIRAAMGMSAANLDTQLAAIPTTIRVKKNAALAGFAFPMVDSSDVPATGLTVTATRSLDGGSFASCANAVSEISGGGYKIDLAASDLNANTVLLKFAASGAKTLWVMVVTQP